MLKKVSAFYPLLIIAVSFLAYFNSFHVPFQYDDQQFIVENNYIQRPISLNSILLSTIGQPTRMVSFATFAFNYHINGLNVLGYHIFNFGLHVGVGFLIFWLVHLLFLTPKIQNSKENLFQATPIALLTSLLFVIHPGQTQAVTYITQRIESLATFFYLLSLCFYLKVRLTKGPSLLRPFFLSATIVSVILGMLTKEVVLTLPLMIILIEILFFDTFHSFFRFTPSQKTIIVLALFLLLLLSLIIPTLFRFEILELLMRNVQSRAHDGETINFVEYFLTQFRVLGTFFRLFFIPVGQNLDYDFPKSHSLWEPATLSSFLFLLSILVGGIFMRKRFRLISFGLFWFFLTASINFIPREHLISEHKFYLISVGLCLSTVVCIFNFVQNPRTRILIFSFLIAGLCFLTYQRNKVWQTEISLWQDVVQKSPHKKRPLLNLGAAYASQKDYANAILYYSKAAEAHPQDDEIFSSRGLFYLQTGKIDLALKDMNHALELNPSSDQAYLNRGNVFVKMRNFDKAIVDFSEILRTHPDHFQAYNNRGATYMNMKEYQNAENDFRRALAINPQFIEAKTNLANVYYLRGISYFDSDHPEEALADFNKSIELDPNQTEAYFHRGIVYTNSNNFKNAVSDFTNIIQKSTSSPEAYLRRGFALSRMNRLKEALEDYNAVVRLSPEHGVAYFFRGQCQKELGNFPAALEDFQKASSLGVDVSPAEMEEISTKIQK